MRVIALHCLTIFRQYDSILYVEVYTLTKENRYDKKAEKTNIKFGVFGRLDRRHAHRAFCQPGYKSQRYLALSL